ncbi:MAG: GYF domain-containing protein [Candidatus Methylacidiphilales bacterium]
MEYYLWTKNGQQGPFTREELETMYRTGQLLEPDLQYTTDDGETWFPMGHLFAPGGYAAAGHEESDDMPTGTVLGIARSPGRSGRIGSAAGSRRSSPERDRLAPLDIGDEAAQEQGQGNVPSGGAGGDGSSSGSRRTRERPMKPKGPQHRTQRIEPSDSYVRMKDAIKPPVAYRIMRDGQESGPFEEPFLRRWVETGALDKDTPSRRDGTRDWEPLWHLLKMTPPGPVEVEIAQGRRAMRTLVVTGKVLALAGVALLVWGLSMPLMHTVYPIAPTVTLATMRTPALVTMWEFHPDMLLLLAVCGLMSLLASLYRSSRWLWVSWGGVLAGVVWVGVSMLQHQILLRERVAMLRPGILAGTNLQRKFLDGMGTLPNLQFGAILLISAVILIGIGAMVMQLSMSSRWRRL